MLCVEACRLSLSSGGATSSQPHLERAKPKPPKPEPNTRRKSAFNAFRSHDGSASAQRGREEPKPRPATRRNGESLPPLPSSIRLHQRDIGVGGERATPCCCFQWSGTRHVAWRPASPDCSSFIMSVAPLFSLTLASSGSGAAALRAEMLGPRADSMMSLSRSKGLP